ncbi:hypothetical protein [Tropicimonas sp. IMCC6043]|uniref:hypothetical protein n=1 Tax=Tropicimonas sp. IMCC6043 TaxID=2510645 RepID=UPI00101C2383|nr:hypothetical protein [Tropicimonas sp. IMCC6043]RYH12112.1 hypothetical protein EU800_00655 [Tropicimonas sp. IMCC6043]
MPPSKTLPALGLVFCSTALIAQPYTPQGEVDGWGIFVNEANKSCFMETTTTGGLIMQMGTGGEVEFGFLALYTKGETDIRDGETGEITLQLGDQRFSAIAEGVARDGYSGGFVIGNNPLLAYDLAKQPELIVNPDGENVFTVDLTGSEEAMQATRVCQLKIDG